MSIDHVQLFFFFFNDTATTEIYTLSLHDALPIYADDVDCEHALQPLGRHVFDARAQIDHAGVVDQRRYAPSGPLRLVEQANDVVFARDIGSDGDAANFFGELLRRRTLAAIVNAHRVAALRRQARSRRADAATPAGDDHHAAHLSAPAGTACRDRPGSADTRSGGHGCRCPSARFPPCRAAARSFRRSTAAGWRAPRRGRPWSRGARSGA